MKLEYPPMLKVTTWKKAQKTKFFMIKNTGISEILRTLKKLHDDFVDTYEEPKAYNYKTNDIFISSLNKDIKAICENISNFQHKILLLSKEKNYVPFFNNYCQKLSDVAGEYVNNAVNYGKSKKLSMAAKGMEKPKNIDIAIKNHFQDPPADTRIFLPDYIRKKYLKEYEVIHGKCKKASGDLINSIEDITKHRGINIETLAETKNCLNKYLIYTYDFAIKIYKTDASRFPPFVYKYVGDSWGNFVNEYIKPGEILNSIIEREIQQRKNRSNVPQPLPIDLDNLSNETKLLNSKLRILTASARNLEKNSARFVVFLMKPQVLKQPSE
ncbi:MAG TPA: hypothetical protein HPQ04_08265 [Rhodospirillaceae bacterium]|nr:hypothetical protein [Rhodospirillaceae bacterium]